MARINLPFEREPDSSSRPGRVLYSQNNVKLAINGLGMRWHLDPATQQLWFEDAYRSREWGSALMITTLSAPCAT